LQIFIQKQKRWCLSIGMNQAIRWIQASMVACAICSLATYRISYHRGFKSGYRNGLDTAIGECRFGQSAGTLEVLQRLRAGDIPQATRMLETSCFDSAHIFYEKPAPIGEASQWVSAQILLWYPGPAEARALAQGLSQYRGTYRTNSADWDVMERKLVVELANVK